jgi:hypothetical protein
MTACCVLICSCGSGSQPVASNAESSQAGSEASGRSSIVLTIDPSPPKVGDNAVAVLVRGADGTPVSDANVAVTFYMPAMPSMGMPEMRSTLQLTPAGEGRYNGTGNLIMSGTWNVTIDVSRANEKLATRKMSVIAK